MKTNSKLLVLATAALTFCQFTLANVAHETKDFKSIETTVNKLVKKYGKEEVLVVFDLDNTLLAMGQSLGSDQWFNWQAKLDKKSEHKVSQSFGGLLSTWYKLLALSKMTPTTPGMSDAVKRIQSAAGNTIVLTSRGKETRQSTLKSLKNHGLSFSDTELKVLNPTNRAYSPYHPEKVAQTLNLKKDLLKSFKLHRKSRAVTYGDGLYLTAGQHKGAMLQLLLNRANKSYKAIVFADDHSKHTDGMQKFFKGRKGLELHTFRFGSEDDKVKAFHAGDKKKAKEGWITLKSTMKKVFNN